MRRLPLIAKTSGIQKQHFNGYLSNVYLITESNDEHGVYGNKSNEVTKLVKTDLYWQRSLGTWKSFDKIQNLNYFSVELIRRRTQITIFTNPSGNTLFFNPSLSEYTHLSGNFQPLGRQKRLEVNS